MKMACADSWETNISESGLMHPLLEIATFKTKTHAKWNWLFTLKILNTASFISSLFLAANIICEVRLYRQKKVQLNSTEKMVQQVRNAMHAWSDGLVDVTERCMMIKTRVTCSQVLANVHVIEKKISTNGKCDNAHSLLHEAGVVIHAWYSEVSFRLPAEVLPTKINNTITSASKV